MDHSTCIFFSDVRFRDRALWELRGAFSGLEFKVDRKNDDYDRFFLGTANADHQAMVARFVECHPVFTETMVPVIAQFEGPAMDYAQVRASIEGDLHKGCTFRIQVLNLGGHTGLNAKGMEVKLGREIEADGFRADLRGAEKVFYVVSVYHRVIVGRLSSGLPLVYTADYFRHGAGSAGRRVSRSEFKLGEAIAFFGIDLRRVRQALDIGAAPGGWTEYVSSMGITTVAIDNALLSYDRLSGRVIVVPQERYASETRAKLQEFSGKASISIAGRIGDAVGRFDVLHVRDRAQDIDASTIEPLGKFDMLLIDANVEPKLSCDIALRFAAALNTGAYLVLTVKLMDERIDEHLKEIPAALIGEYERVQFRKLPHNRMELTCFAVKK